MRKILLVLTVFFAFSATTFAQETEPWTCPEGLEGQTLSIYNWSTYIADTTIPDFEEACGVSVVYDVYGSAEEMLARISQGNPGYDIVVPSNNILETMINRELALPLDYANIPNAANVSEFLLDPAYDPGNVYSLPYQWGTVGVGYNVTAVGEEITSWEQVFNYDGPVAWLDDPRLMFGIALVMLGYDPNSTNPDEIAQARDFLLENGDNVVAIAADDGQALLDRGDVDIAIEFNGDIFQLIADCECDDYAYVLPEPMAQIWVDSLAIPTGAPNQALAEVFIDYIYDPQVGADISNYTAYASPNQAAIDAGLILPEYLESTAIYPDSETSERLFSSQALPEAEQFYNDAWDEVKILIGR